FLAAGAATAVLSCAGARTVAREQPSLGGSGAAGLASATPGDAIGLSIVVNGERRALRIDPRTTLLDLLRENLRLTGAKKGCDMGQCGACTVLADGARINSCLALAAQYDGREITTIEGLAAAGALQDRKSTRLNSSH